MSCALCSCGFLNCVSTEFGGLEPGTVPGLNATANALDVFGFVLSRAAASPSMASIRSVIDDGSFVAASRPGMVVSSVTPGTLLLGPDVPGPAVPSSTVSAASPTTASPNDRTFSYPSLSLTDIFNFIEDSCVGGNKGFPKYEVRNISCVRFALRSARERIVVPVARSPRDGAL